MMVSAPDPNTKVLPLGFISSVEVEPVGRWFLAQWHRIHSAKGLSISERNLSASESEESEPEVEFEDELDFLRSLDPKECKDQDHYRVLGLAQLRTNATDEQIRKAYRFKVLRHHPDKRRGAGEDIREDDDYFTCITKAFEQLGTPPKRRAYDSVDPTFDDDVPEMKVTAENKEELFFKLFGPVIEKNSRWSNKNPVPKLGDMSATREQVDKFYKFWYEFDSWREYSYLDEEDKEKGSDREERRWIEKNNRVQRNERKKEEMKRIRKLVDNAYNSDPRIARFRDLDKQEKLAKKKAKADAAQARRDEEERIRREAEEKDRKEKELMEALLKERQEELKREKEATKKAIKKERKCLRNACKESNFFACPDDLDEKIKHMADVDRLCEILSLVELEDLNKNLAANVTSQRETFIATVTQLNEKLDKEKMELVMPIKSANSSASLTNLASKREWSADELALLIKAVNLFPAGTNERWEVVAGFINQHTKTPDMVRNAKETLFKAKELQHGDFHTSSLKEEANKRAYENLENSLKKDIKVDVVEATTRTDSAADLQGVNLTPWSAEEQKLLEQALKTFPATLGTERWDKIAESIPNRSKKDCMRRYKELAEVVRAKKAAMAQATAAAKK